MPSTPYRVGIVGVGWGTIVHVPAFRLVDGFEVAALCGRTPERLAAAASQAGISDTSTDWQSFVQREDLDVIAVATPVPWHHPMTLAGLAAGKHVLCEKPLSLTVAEGHEMADAADAAARNGKATATCFENRWNGERARIRDLVRNGHVGDPFFVRLSQSASYWHPSRKNQALWMYDLAEGGGYLNGLLAHDIDFVCALFGRPTAVCAEVRTAVPTRPLPDGGTLQVSADDTSALLLRLDSGALAVISASVVGVHAVGAQLDLFGRNGTITGSLGGRKGETSLLAATVTDAGLAPVGLDERAVRSGRPLPERGAAAAIRAMALMLEDWLVEIEGGVSPNPIPSIRDGLLVQQVIEGARASSAGAGWVNLAD